MCLLDENGLAKMNQDFEKAHSVSFLLWSGPGHKGSVNFEKLNETSLERLRICFMVILRSVS